MISLSDLFSDRNSFETKEGILNSIRDSKNFDETIEDPAKADALIIFMTSKQHTWLVCSEHRLYCVLDDLKNRKPHINWAMSKSLLVSHTEVTVAIKTRDKSKDTGLVDIGDKHRNWLYTKKLFMSEPIDKMIKELITRQIILKEY